MGPVSTFSFLWTPQPMLGIPGSISEYLRSPPVHEEEPFSGRHGLAGNRNFWMTLDNAVLGLFAPGRVNLVWPDPTHDPIDLLSSPWTMKSYLCVPLIRPLWALTHGALGIFRPTWVG